MVEEDRIGRAGDRGIDVGVGQDDCRRLAAQFPATLSSNFRPRPGREAQAAAPPSRPTGSEKLLLADHTQRRSWQALTAEALGFGEAAARRPWPAR
jgi:hypothetical protein